MSNSWLSEWSNSKIELASRLNSGECGGTYAEAVIVLCSVLSGIAADIWPGRNIDRKRFVELLVKYSDAKHCCQKASIPLLVGAVRDSGDSQLATQVRNELLPFSETRVIAGEEVDKAIDELQISYPAIDVLMLKRNSYACLLYEEIRSGFVHEYRPGERSDSFVMGSLHHDSPIRYINRADKPDRLIYFNVSWLASIITDVVDNLSKNDPLPKFNNYTSWWIEK